MSFFVVLSPSPRPLFTGKSLRETFTYLPTLPVSPVSHSTSCAPGLLYTHEINTSARIPKQQPSQMFTLKPIKYGSILPVLER